MPKSKKPPEIKNLFYITHIENLPSILSKGIFSHQKALNDGVNYRRIYDEEIVGNRKAKKAPDGKSLWDFANVYFQPRNPMLYRVLHEKGSKEIAVLGIEPGILRTCSYITDGNAASDATVFFNYNDGVKAISGIWKTIQEEWWSSTNGSKRKIMAECLVRDFIPPDTILAIYVSSHKVADEVRKIITPKNVSVIPEPKMFFLPIKKYSITNSLFLAEGDMFFSKMQTLTVSVNTVGIMGKGLASRTKYQFPDVYVVYQDACRSKKLKMGKPFLYKREGSFDDELVDEPTPTANGVKWFLLFATKTHWSLNSDIHGIEEGLQWLLDNYKKEKILSIALPALGCGLGNLEWKNVGPMMCRYLTKIDIQATIYLPREKEIPEEFLSKDYLLKK